MKSRRDRRREAKEKGVKFQPQPGVSMTKNQMTPAQIAAMNHEIRQQCLKAEQELGRDLDTVVLWVLMKHYGWGKKRLHDFYLLLAQEHINMKHHYEMDDTYPERYHLKERGVDLDEWEKEVEDLKPTV